MGGWSAEGLRVVLGSSVSVEPRDFNVYLGGDLVSTTRKYRLVTVSRAEWRGLTAAGAASKTATATWAITARDRAGDSGQWRVNEEITTRGDWTENENGIPTA